MDKILRVCIYPQCGWVGYTGDTCSLGQIDLLCPDCHGTTEELTPRWARELIALETSSAPGRRVAMNELKSKHLWPLVEQFATTDTSNPENTVPGWVALAMLDDLRRLQQTVPAPQAQGVSVPYPIRSVLDAALIVYITECRQVDDPDGETLAHQAQQWLDSQRPAPGEEE